MWLPYQPQVHKKQDSYFKIHEALLKANSNNVLNLKEEMVTGSDKIMETLIDDMENLLHKIHTSL